MKYNHAMAERETLGTLKTEYPSYTEHSLPAVTRGKTRPASANGMREDNHGGR